MNNEVMTDVVHFSLYWLTKTNGSGLRLPLEKKHTFSSVLQEASSERSKSERTDVRWYSLRWNHACVFGSYRLGL